MYSRQAQLELTDIVQQRLSKLDTFAKLFFPTTHNMSDGHVKFTTFNFAEEKSGIYGFDCDELILNSSNARNRCPPGASVNEGSENTKYSVNEDTISILIEKYNSTAGPSVSGYLFQQLAGFDLYLSKQYTAALDHFNEQGWQFDDKDTLTFTTMGISGKLEHTIASQLNDLSTILPTIYKTNNASLSLLAKACFIILVGLFILFFYNRVSFIVHRVFGIDIPEIVRNNKIENLISDELELSGQCLIFINGTNKNIEDFSLDQLEKADCLDKINKETCLKKFEEFNFVLEPIAKSGIRKFVSSFKFNFGNNEADQEGVTTFFVISEFFTVTSSRVKRIQLLDYIEKQQKKARPHNRIFILICAEIHPLRCLVKPELYAGTHMQRFAFISSKEEKYRWINVLTKFLEHNNHQKLNSTDVHTNTSDKQYGELDLFIKENIIWPDSVRIRNKAEEFLNENKGTHEITKEEVIEYIGNYNYPYYRRLWESCNTDERLMLYQLSINQFINPLNRGVIRSLYSRGYIVPKPFFQIPDHCFKQFVLAAEPLSTFQQWEKNANQSLWTSIKAPIFIVLVVLAGLFIYISTDALETTIGLLTPLLALIPLLLRSISNVQASNLIDKVEAIDDLND